MPITRPLNGLRIVEVQYGGARLVEPDYWAFGAYRTTGAYDRAGVPVEAVRPLVLPDALTGDEPTRLGAVNGAIANAVAEGLRAGQGIVLAGGNCHHATGVVGGIQDALGAGVRLGLVWFDAHGDFNTPQTTISGSLGGMPFAVCAGLCFPSWREGAHIAVPLPTDRLLLWDGRNLDPAEAALIRAVGLPVAARREGALGMDLRQAVDDLTRRVDVIYLHIDADILDVAYMPNHRTGEPDGPNMAQVVAAVETVMATSKVIAYALVSVFTEGEGGDTSIAAGCELLAYSLAAWGLHGVPPTSNQQQATRNP